MTLGYNISHNSVLREGGRGALKKLRAELGVLLYLISPLV